MRVLGASYWLHVDQTCSARLSAGPAGPWAWAPAASATQACESAGRLSLLKGPSQRGLALVAVRTRIEHASMLHVVHDLTQANFISASGRSSSLPFAFGQLRYCRAILSTDFMFRVCSLQIWGLLSILQFGFLLQVPAVRLE